jgi:serine/threonine-protein kinase
METTPRLPRRDAERDRLAAALPAYEVGGVLGRGGFAVVYAGRHRRLGREVAIKRLSVDLLQAAEARERFSAEARLLAALDHPHIVRVYDFVDDEDVSAFVMERMRGGTLADRLAGGRVERAWACGVVLAALHGLEHAHREGVLHRDVKPENLLFGARAEVKVADFGIAKVVGAEGARLTATTGTLGTPAYMAPEQVTRSAGSLSPATDVWAAGAVLYEMLAGEPPFRTDGEIGDVLYQRMTDTPRPLRAVAPDVPGALASVVMRALERAPAARYPTAAAFAAALEPAAGADALAATGIAIHRTPARPEEPAPPAVREPPRRRRWGVAGAAAVLLVIAAAVAALTLPGGGPDTPTPRGAAARALPPAPHGWPREIAAGYNDEAEGLTGIARRVGRGGATFAVFSGDPAARNDWSHDPDQPEPAALVRSARSAGLFPYLNLFEIRALGRSGRPDSETPQLRRTLRDRRLMTIYWRNVRDLLRRLGSTRTPVALSVDANLWSYLEADLDAPGEPSSSVAARVGSTGLPELRGIEDTLRGFAKAWRALRDRDARNVALGYAFDDWATNVDISEQSPSPATAAAAGREAGRFYRAVVGDDFDFAALVINGEGAEEGQNHSPEVVYSHAEKDAVVAFVRDFVRVAGVRVVLENVPFGNTVSKAISDRAYHWHDSWVQWLMGSDRFDGLRRFRDAGVIGLMFGVSDGPNETCPCDAAEDGVTNDGKYARRSTSADDDGGYFAERAAALRKAGSLSLP